MTQDIPNGPARATLESTQRFGEVVGELQGLLTRLEAGTRAERRRVYDRCVPLLTEAKTLTMPPLPVKKLKALTHEAGWHIRSLAGLTAINGSEDGEHRAWAESSLRALAECVEQGCA